MNTSEVPSCQDLLESMAAEMLMPSSFVEQRPSAASSENNMNNRMLEDLLRLLQQQNTQLQPFASVSFSSILRDSLETIKRDSTIALHNRAANSIFNAGEATNTNAIEQCQEPATASGGILRVPCRARGMPKDHAIFKVSYLWCSSVLRWVYFASSFQHSNSTS
jgi:hypothetical protein